MNRLFIVIACCAAPLFTHVAGNSFAATIHMERVNPMYRSLWEKTKALPLIRRNVQAVRVCHSFAEVKKAIKDSLEHREASFDFDMVYNFAFADLDDTCDAGHPCAPGDPGYKKGILNQAFDEVTWADDYLAYNFVGYSIAWSGSDDDVTVSYGYKKPVIYLTTYKQEQYVNGRVAVILPKIIGENMTDVEKEKAIHDWIVANLAYNESADLQNVDYTAYAALYYGTTVCQGYSLLNFKMLENVGITARIVSSDSMNHAWNMSLVCGHWYHEDLTWDDPVLPDGSGPVIWKYFNLSDSQIGKDHSGWVKSTLPPPPSAPDAYVSGICIIRGDLDGNNMLDLGDLVIALKICAGLAPAPVNMEGDTNSDKPIGMTDALYIIRAISGLR